MPEWIEHLFQPVVDAASELCRNRSGKQTLGILAAIAAVCMVAGLVTTTILGANLSVLTFTSLMALSILLVCCSLYCSISP